MTTTLEAAARKTMWRAALTLSGGVTVTGSLPAGGCVVVANHSSHADTAALLATFPADRRPVVVAAADYWGSTPTRALACRLLAGGVPVRRGGHGSQDLERLLPALADGRTVVIFPEGTRSRDGALGTFHTGAFRLAQRADVPVVPVALVGTSTLLAVHGSLRPTAVDVRIGAARPGASAEATRATVAELGRAVRRRPDSRLRQQVRRFACGRRGVALVAAWAFAEAFSFPLVPELLLAMLVVAAPRAGLRLSLTAAGASVVGGVAALLLAQAGLTFPQPLTTARMHHEVHAELTAEGAAGVGHQALDGIPFKVYAAEAGGLGVSPVAFAEAAAQSRGLRILLVGLGLSGFGLATRRLRHLYPLYVGLVSTGFVVGLVQVVRLWS